MNDGFTSPFDSKMHVYNYSTFLMNYYKFFITMHLHNLKKIILSASSRSFNHYGITNPCYG